MTVLEKPSPADVRRARTENPKLRERDLACRLGISEAELVAAHVGHGAVRMEPRVSELLESMAALGEVLALTRNESAVHEKIGVYDKVVTGRRSALVLGSEIDLRIFPGHWQYGFAVEKSDGAGIRRSLQFFDAAGDAVHKIHLRPASDVVAYEKLVERLAAADQPQTIEVEPARKTPRPQGDVSRQELRRRWEAMTDVHQFVGILKAFGLSRHQAVSMVGEEYARQLDLSALRAMMAHAVDQHLPIMCFVGNRGCIQIHSGPVANVKTMGPWLNVMDETFHLHLRHDHIRELWAVRKPNREGYVTSIEAYNAEGEMIIQFFGKRREGEDERAEWRLIAENLPSLPGSTAA